MTDVVASGTGANYAIVAGAMDRLLANGLKPSALVATSGSSIVFAHLAAGGTPKSFLDFSKECPPVRILRPNWLWPFIPGLVTAKPIIKALAPHIPRAFAQCKVPLTIIATDSDTAEPLYFSSHLTPKMSVGKAIHASISVPWLMRHANIDGVRATDGGTTHNFAIDLPENPPLGIRVLGAKSTPKPWRWWPSYSLNHIDAMIRSQERAHISSGVWNRAKVLTIESPISSMDYFKVDAQMLDKLYVVGQTAVTEKIASGWDWRPG